MRTLIYTLLVISLALVSVTTAQEDSQQSFVGISFKADAAGVFVTQVLPNSPASEAGLQVGDIITAVDGVPVSEDTFAQALQGRAFGDVMSFTVQRADTTVRLDMTLVAQPAASASTAPLLSLEFFAYLPDAGIWQIPALTENSPLYEAGLRAGDKITGFNGEIYDRTELHEFLAGMRADTMVTVTVERENETLALEVPAAALNVLANPNFALSDPDIRIPLDQLFGFESFNFFLSRESILNRLETLLDRYFDTHHFHVSPRSIKSSA